MGTMMKDLFRAKFALKVPYTAKMETDTDNVFFGDDQYPNQFIVDDEDIITQKTNSTRKTKISEAQETDRGNPGEDDKLLKTGLKKIMKNSGDKPQNE